MRRVLPFVAVAVAASAVTAAAVVIPARAAGDDDRPSAGARFAEFQACMKEQGFDIGGDVEIVIRRGEVTINGKTVDAEAFREARRACGGPLRRGLRFGLLPRLDRLPDDAPPELRERVERLRECLEQARTT